MAECLTGTFDALKQMCRFAMGVLDYENKAGSSSFGADHFIGEHSVYRIDRGGYTRQTS
jgi:hypothetical protein